MKRQQATGNRQQINVLTYPRSAITEAETVQVGVMCASPEREWFQVIFEDVHIETL
ncbi:MAG: hypothetical protein ACLFWI_05180 [Coleofasciculus sp.]|uniref:hypothetical protein n=1 Tax=Coleofasciculus sp. TaxID=3100458 RepID=UPI003A231EBD